jgi:hypothetical protein
VISSSVIKNLAKYLLLLGIGVLLLWLTFKGQDLKKIANDIYHAHPLYVLLSVLAGFVAFLLRAYRWNMLIEPLGYRSDFLNASYALGLGYFANLAIPRIGEITRCGVLHRTDKIPVDKLIGTVITERVIDLIMLFLSVAMVAALQFNLIAGFLRNKVFSGTAGSGTATLYLLGALATLLVIAGLMLLLSGNHKVVKLREKIILLIRGVWTGLFSVTKVKHKGLFILHTFVIWILYFISAYLCFFALEATNHLGWKEGLFILVAGGLGMSAPVQGGIGAYHYIVSQALILFGIAESDGITYATLVHSYQMLLIIVLGLISLFMLFLRKI